MSEFSLSLVNDTGRPGDNVTADGRLQGFAAPNSPVTISDSHGFLDTVFTDETGNFRYSPVIADGNHQFSASQIGTDGVSSTTNLSILLDTTPPSINLFRINDFANTDLPFDLFSNAFILNIDTLEKDIYLNSVSYGVETGNNQNLNAKFSFVSISDPTSTLFSLSPVVRPFPNNPVGDGVFTSVMRATSIANTFFKQYIGDGFYQIRVDVSDLAGNSAPEVVKNIIVDSHADGFTEDTLVFRVSADSYQGDPHFVVRVDGRQVGGVLTTSASHSQGEIQDITLKGYFGSGAHDVTVQFLDDASGGSADLDRNLYVHQVSLNGQTYAGDSATNPSDYNPAGHNTDGIAALLWASSASFHIDAPPDGGWLS